MDIFKGITQFIKDLKSDTRLITINCVFQVFKTNNKKKLFCESAIYTNLINPQDIKDCIEINIINGTLDSTYKTRDRDGNERVNTYVVNDFATKHEFTKSFTISKKIKRPSIKIHYIGHTSDIIDFIYIYVYHKRKRIVLN